MPSLLRFMYPPCFSIATLSMGSSRKSLARGRRAKMHKAPSIVRIEGRKMIPATAASNAATAMVAGAPSAGTSQSTIRQPAAAPARSKP